eukprot:4331831-Alexandrium_andersonii.AAC.1
MAQRPVQPGRLRALAGGPVPRPTAPPAPTPAGRRGSAGAADGGATSRPQRPFGLGTRSLRKPNCARPSTPSRTRHRLFR